jgi:hypothetical protein
LRQDDDLSRAFGETLEHLSSSSERGRSAVPPLSLRERAAAGRPSASPPIGPRSHFL